MEADEELDHDFKLHDLAVFLSNIRLHGAPGPDDIYADFLLYSPKSFRSILLDLFNFSWQHGVIPADWLRADVCVIRKPGSPSDQLDSYRPISLTSVVMKSFERLVYARILPRIASRLTRFQAGFRSKHSCFDNIPTPTHYP
jgi:hypothetical protein